MRRLNNYDLIYESNNIDIPEIQTRYHSIGYILNYLNVYFLHIQQTLLLIHKYETWYLTPLILPSLNIVSRYKSIFFKRNKQIINNKLLYVWRVFIPSEDDLTHYLTGYLTNILSFFFKVFWFGFLKLILLYSFWQIKLFKIISYMLRDLLDIFLAEIIAIILYFLE